MRIRPTVDMPFKTRLILFGNGTPLTLYPLFNNNTSKAVNVRPLPSGIPPVRKFSQSELKK